MGFKYYKKSKKSKKSKKYNLNKHAKKKVLPGFELGTQGSKPCVLNHYTIRQL